MDVQSKEGCSVHCLHHSVAVVLHRVSTEGLQLPQVCRQRVNPSSKPGSALSPRPALSGESPTGKGSVRGHRRVRSPPNRLIELLCSPAITRGSKVTLHAQPRVAVNGYKGRRSSKTTTRQDDGCKQSATNQHEGDYGKFDPADVPSHSTPLPARNERKGSLATGGVNSSSIHPRIQLTPKSLSLCISRPTTATQLRTSQQRSASNIKGVKTGTVVSDRRRVGEEKRTKRRKRVVSVAFLDSSDISDGESDVEKWSGKVRKRGRTSGSGQSDNLAPRKRRRLSSSAEEVYIYIVYMYHTSVHLHMQYSYIRTCMYMCISLHCCLCEECGNSPGKRIIKCCFLSRRTH